MDGVQITNSSHYGEHGSIGAVLNATRNRYNLFHIDMDTAVNHDAKVLCSLGHVGGAGAGNQGLGGNIADKLLHNPLEALLLYGRIGKADAEKDQSGGIEDLKAPSRISISNSSLSSKTGMPH